MLFQKSKINFINYLKLIFSLIAFGIKFSKIINKINPNYILINQGGFPAGLSGWLASIISKIKYNTFILTHHAPENFKSISYLISKIFCYIIRFQKTPNITVSKASKDLLEHKTPLKNFHVIYNGLDTNIKHAAINFKKIILGKRKDYYWKYWAIR